MKKLLVGLLALLAIGLVGAALQLYRIFLSPVVPENSSPSDFIIHRGMSVTQIADSLYRQNLIADQERFLLAAKLSGWTNQLKAGKYQIPPRSSNYELLQLFRSGRIVQQRVTLPEGRTAEDYAQILYRTLAVDTSAFLELVEDTSFVHELGIEASSLEGYLFPDTYYLYWGASPREVIRVLVEEFHRRVGPLEVQIKNSDMSLHQIVTLASIIEGEAIVDSERQIIAAVYLNRIRRGMRLQADPTIQYAVPGPPRRLLHRDLEIDSPYNTYRYAGLPPGPVNNPGFLSIQAALNPAPVDYLYFVARGDGSHVFSRTLSQHLRAKGQFDRVRARVRREQRNAKIE